MKYGLLAAVLLSSAMASSDETVTVDKHVKVYYEAGRFGGWPANHGMWHWGNEVLVGFSRGYYKDQGPYHHIDHDKPEEHWLARSLDGGETWSLEHPTDKGQLIPQGESLHGTELPGVEIKPSVPFEGKIDFAHPDFTMTLRMGEVNVGPSRFYYSYDRGHDWEGPYLFPNLGTTGVAARTCYFVEGPETCTVFLTSAKENSEEGRSFCARTTDGARTWEFLSWIGPEPKGFSIMPAAARLSDTDVVVCTRRNEEDRRWIDAWISHDDCRTWEQLPDPVEELGEGNPPSLIKLADGRLCLTYGYRAEPFSIRARLSNDGGKTWGQEHLLRDDGSSKDIGYVRSMQRPDGKIVTTYYYSDAVTGPERYIGATIWSAGTP